MAEDNKDQKTEEPTSKRITDTEDKGNFAHSREINSSFILLASLMGFMMMGEQSTKNVEKALKTTQAYKKLQILDILKNILKYKQPQKTVFGLHGLQWIEGRAILKAINNQNKKNSVQTHIPHKLTCSAKVLRKAPQLD